MQAAPSATTLFLRVHLDTETDYFKGLRLPTRVCWRGAAPSQAKQGFTNISYSPLRMNVVAKLLRKLTVPEAIVRPPSPPPPALRAHGTPHLTSTSLSLEDHSPWPWLSSRKLPNKLILETR